MSAFYVDILEHGPKGSVMQVRHLGVIHALDKAHALERAEMRYAQDLETPAQFLQVTRMERPSVNSSRYAAMRAA